MSYTHFRQNFVSSDSAGVPDGAMYEGVSKFSEMIR
jgi:hypothetical protein